jgi:hypothetical protein
VKDGEKERNQWRGGNGREEKKRNGKNSSVGKTWLRHIHIQVFD